MKKSIGGGAEAFQDVLRWPDCELTGQIIAESGCDRLLVSLGMQRGARIVTRPPYQQFEEK